MTNPPATTAPIRGEGRSVMLASNHTRASRLAAGLLLALAALAPGVIAMPLTAAQPDIPCEQWQQMHPGWPCIPVPKPPPGPAPGSPSTPPALPTPAMPGQSPNSSGGTAAGALMPPDLLPGNGTPIVPVPGQASPPPVQTTLPRQPQSGIRSPTIPDSSAPEVSPESPTTPAGPQPVLTKESAASETVKPAAEAQPVGRTSPLTWLLLPLLLAAGAGGVVLGRRLVRDDSPLAAPSTFDGLPGVPPPTVPVPPGAAVSTSRFSITRLYPGVFAPPGWMSKDFNANPGATPGVYRPFQGPYSGYGATIRLDPDTTPGAVGAWSGNVLTPDPMTGKSQLSIPAPPNAQGKPGSLDINATKQVQLRIVGLKPKVLSSMDFNGKPTLAVTYEPTYQVRTQITAMNYMIVPEPSDWTDISIDDVQQLERMGAYVPTIPATS